MWNREELIWAAGLFEGEGCITRAGGYSWAMKLRMTDEDVVRKFYDIIKLGYVGGPYKKLNPDHKDYWEWQTAKANEVYALCAAFWPFMGQRRQAKMTEALLDIPPLKRILSPTCKQGHLYTNENTITYNNGHSISRRCRKCKNEWYRSSYKP